MTDNQDIKIDLNQCLRIDYTLCNLRPVFYFDTIVTKSKNTNKSPDELVLDSANEYISLRKHSNETIGNKRYKYTEYTYKNGVYGLLPEFATTARNLNTCCFKHSL